MTTMMTIGTMMITKRSIARCKRLWKKRKLRFTPITRLNPNPARLKSSLNTLHENKMNRKEPSRRKSLNMKFMKDKKEEISPPEVVAEEAEAHSNTVTSVKKKRSQHHQSLQQHKKKPQQRRVKPSQQLLLRKKNPRKTKSSSI